MSRRTALVSVVIPVCGDARRLRETVKSILAQTYKNIEIVVINDASHEAREETAVIARTFGSKVKLFETTVKGQAPAINFGIKKMTGEYFSWLLPGDVYYPERIEKQIKSIGSASTSIVVSGWMTLTSTNKKVSTHLAGSELERNPRCFLAFDHSLSLDTRAMLFPKKVLSEGKLFKSTLPSPRDYKMLNQLLQSGASLRVIDQSLSCLMHQYEDEVLTPEVARYDFLFSDIIDTLDYSDILDYFRHPGDAISYYKNSLASGYPRTASFLIARIVKGAWSNNGYYIAKRTLLQDVSRLPESKMATDVDTLLAKIKRPRGKKRILFCSGHWLTGGMERVMSVLFRELHDDYEIFLITPYDERKSHIEVPSFVTSIKIAEELFQKHFDSLILSYALLFDIDVVIGYMNMFEKQLDFYGLCAGTKIKTIASNHEYYFYPYKSPVHYGVVEKRLDTFGYCDAVVWPTNFSAALCGMYVDNNYVIGNPNNFAITETRDDVPNEKNILCVGRFNDYVKRIDRILECFALVLRSVPDARLILVGKYDNDAPIRDNNTATVNSLIRSLTLPLGSIDFVGEVDNVHDYYAQAKVLLLTSSSEGFGMVLNEAACFGVPSVCNYIPGIEDIITDGENGFITEQSDIKSMAAKVSEVLTDDDIWIELSKNASKKVTAYDPRYIGDKWRYLVNTLLSTEGRDELHKRLNEKLAYTVQNQQQFIEILARELNEIFNMATEESSGHTAIDKTHLIISKIIGLPGRLRTNIEYEGVIKTVSKIIVRSHKIAWRKLRG